MVLGLGLEGCQPAPQTLAVSGREGKVQGGTVYVEKALVRVDAGVEIGRDGAVCKEIRLKKNFATKNDLFISWRKWRFLVNFSLRVSTQTPSMQPIVEPGTDASSHGTMPSHSSPTVK